MLQFSLFSVTNIHHAVSQSRAAKWTMLTWTDFSYTGFTCMDAPLSSSPEISAPPMDSIPSWSQLQAGIIHKLRNIYHYLHGVGLSLAQQRSLERHSWVYLLFNYLIYVVDGWAPNWPYQGCTWALVSAAI